MQCPTGLPQIWKTELFPPTPHAKSPESFDTHATLKTRLVEDNFISFQPLHGVHNSITHCTVLTLGLPGSSLKGHSKRERGWGRVTGRRGWGRVTRRRGWGKRWAGRRKVREVGKNMTEKEREKVTILLSLDLMDIQDIRPTTHLFRNMEHDKFFHKIDPLPFQNQ